MSYEVRNLTDAEIDTVAGGFLALTLLRACMSVAHAPTGNGGGQGSEEDTAESDTGGENSSAEDEGSDK